LLIEAKSRVRHGEWLSWLEANCPLSDRQARNYMRLARNRQRVADLPSVREAVAFLAEPATAASTPPNPLGAAVANRDALEVEAVALTAGEGGYDDNVTAARAWVAVAEANRKVVQELGRRFCALSLAAESAGDTASASAFARAGAAGMVYAAHYEPWDEAHGDAVDEWAAALDAIADVAGKATA
jgi:hypothetical protein